MTLRSIAKTINKEYGDGSIFMMKDAGMFVEVVPTGILELDDALGGGFPKGRISEVFGQESSGKTTIALSTCASAHKMGINAAYVDVEHALDPRWMDVIGIDQEKTLISQPDTGEEALEIVEKLIESGEVGVIVVDSVSALLPRAEAAGDFGDSHIGLQARLMSQGMRKINGKLSKSECLIVFINQIREKVGVVFGNPEVTSGGRALKFYSSVRVETRSPRSASVKDGEEYIGRTIKATVVKNKVAPPFRVAEFDLMYETGISFESSLFRMALDRGILGKKGAWYFDAASGENIGQGKDKAVKWLLENPDEAKRIEVAVMGRDQPQIEQ